MPAMPAMPATPSMRICILGATGLVGRETLDLVARAWPGAELLLFASRDKTLEHGDRTYEVLAADRLERDDALKGDLAFVALDDEYSKRYVPRLLALGYRVVDKSNTYRMDPKVPLVAAGVNCGAVTETTNLVANPNCTTIPFTMALVPLRRQFGLVSVAVSSYQAISGAGIGALDSFLSASKAAYAEPNRFGSQLDPEGYPGNTVPHSGKTDASGYSAEERKLVNESRKILDLSTLKVSAQCCRVPIAVGHFMNVWFTLGQPANVRDLELALSKVAGAPFLRMLAGAAGEGLTALAAVQERDLALAGRLRRDHRDEDGRGFCMTVTADNLRLGAATNAVRIASRWFPSHDRVLQAPGNLPE